MSERPASVTAKIHRIQDLRRSGASGLHHKWAKDRANTNRKAIERDRNDG